MRPPTNGYGEALGQMGRLNEAVAQYKRALELDPLSRVITGIWDLFSSLNGVRPSNRARAKNIRNRTKLRWRALSSGQAYILKIPYKEAIAEAEKDVLISPRSVDALRGSDTLIGGGYERALKVLDKLTQLSKQMHVPPSYMAAIHVGLVEKDKAFEWLEKGYEERSIGSGFGINPDPIWIRCARTHASQTCSAA